MILSRHVPHAESNQKGIPATAKYSVELRSIFRTNQTLKPRFIDNVRRCKTFDYRTTQIARLIDDTKFGNLKKFNVSTDFMPHLLGLLELLMHSYIFSDFLRFNSEYVKTYIM